MVTGPAGQAGQAGLYHTAGGRGYSSVHHPHHAFRMRHKLWPHRNRLGSEYPPTTQSAAPHTPWMPVMLIAGPRMSTRADTGDIFLRKVETHSITLPSVEDIKLGPTPKEKQGPAGKQGRLSQRRDSNKAAPDASDHIFCCEANPTVWVAHKRLAPAGRISLPHFVAQHAKLGQDLKRPQPDLRCGTAQYSMRPAQVHGFNERGKTTETSCSIFRTVHIRTSAMSPANETGHGIRVLTKYELFGLSGCRHPIRRGCRAVRTFVSCRVGEGKMLEQEALGTAVLQSSGAVATTQPLGSLKARRLFPFLVLFAVGHPIKPRSRLRPAVAVNAEGRVITWEVGGECATFGIHGPSVPAGHA
ncbi:hypothetical protein MKZ38_008292 [Zalerion maritima]|uniref:Uncharacterized protein n=1 Tax=Zalerion maritima TaxID=339359 RepID=A0AAD5RHU5_9PEZI|nr:hypothetical protein MKZ38_008292 [Zalerion maritima]